MVFKRPNSENSRPAGYQALIDRFELQVMANWHRSFVTETGSHQRLIVEGQVEEVFTKRYWPGEDLGSHLEFALKYDGVNLGILAEVFQAAPTQEIIDFIVAKPMGKYTRKVWYLYEWITQTRLPLDDLKRGNYINLLEPELYYTGRGLQIRRQKINDNLLGSSTFCPIVRRTETLAQMEETNFTEKCSAVIDAFPKHLLGRATDYLYKKETKSSFEIERETPSSQRTDRFVLLLQQAEKEDFCSKERLIEAQNLIVDDRFMDSDYRTSQNYVGQTVNWSEQIHFVSPRPSDLATLMEGWEAAHRRMDGHVHPIVHGAAISYGFVFLHPFEDGNGRIHRFLIHNIFARNGLTPKGTIFPVSASMLANPSDYDGSLEAFSKPLMPLVDYTLKDNGELTVRNQTRTWYRFMDMTAQVEALFHFVAHTIETELKNELTFLLHYDQAKRGIQAIIDMPDREIDRFMRFCAQNNNRLSGRKRTRFFAYLTDQECEAMELVLKNVFENADNPD